MAARGRAQTAPARAPENPAIRKFSDVHLTWLLRSTLTIDLHDAPRDYYRFSRQAFREVFFEGLREVEVYPVLLLPIIIGSGIKP
jgi:hypothetical protein